MLYNQDPEIFRIEDLIWNERFREWVLNPTAELDLHWMEWMQKNPEKKELIGYAAQVVKSVGVKPLEVSERELESFVADTMNKISLADKQSGLAVRGMSGFKRSTYRLAAAASVLLLTCISLWFTVSESKKQYITYSGMVKSSPGKYIERANYSARPLKIVLSDGSYVVLEKNARVSFERSFRQSPRREVFLSGEAFFKVAKNPAKPFLVYANGLATKVLGTSFRIRSYDAEKNVTVEVKTGNVSVFSLTGDNVREDIDNKKLVSDIILTRNQKVFYSREQNTLTKMIVEKPVPDPAVKINFEFTDTPVNKVFDAFRKTYGVAVIYDPEIMSGCTLTASLSNKPMYQQLDIISTALGTHYEMLDGNIVFYSQGCK